jgi:hypothetical protein
VFLALALSLVGCGRDQPPRPAPGQVAPIPPFGAVLSVGKSDLDEVRAADVSILFVGNSHTSSHDLPNLVCQMIAYLRPEKKIAGHVVGAAFLEDAARDPRCREEIETRPWKYVVLQAQKISVSGRFAYSRKEGIDLAKLAKARGASVYFFAEWGLQGVAGDGPRQEKVYQEMARAADVGVARVGRAWDLALAQRPELPLYSEDGNHQSPLGAYLTACVLVGRLTGEAPSALASFPYGAADEPERKILADAAAQALREDR